MNTRKARKPEPPRATPVSLAPLSTEEALEALLQTPPSAVREPKPKKRSRRSGPEAMATYKQVQAHVRQRNGFVPQTCWIAHVMSDFGLTTRTAPNRINTGARAKPCPPDKRQPIIDTLRHFRMI